MDLDRFWELVEAAAAAADGDCQAQAERLTAMLEELAAGEVVSFEWHFPRRLAEARRWHLGVGLPARRWLLGRRLRVLRCWLLAQGRATWEAALRDPDSLVDHPVAGWSGQDLERGPMPYVAVNAYHARAGAELPGDGHVRQPAEPLGERRDFEDDGEVRRRLPRAWARLT